MNCLSAIPLVNPGYLWACGGLLLIPLLIYILNRSRHRDIPWAAMRFLISANRKNIRRTRVEQLLLLAVRTILITLLGLSLARPVLQSGAAASLLNRNTHHIFVLDNSFSMAASGSQSSTAEQEHGAFHAQEQHAQRLLGDLPSGSAVSVITMGYPARELNFKPILDHALASRLIQTVELGHASTDLLGALNLVRTRITSQQHDQRETEVHIFGDFAKPVFAPQAIDGGTQDTLKSLARDISKRARLVLYDVYTGATANLANTDLKLAGSLVGVGQLVQLHNTITNVSKHQSTGCTIRLSVDGKTIRELSLEPIEAGASRTLSHAIEFVTAGLHRVESVLMARSGNVLKIDDARRLVIDVRTSIPVLMVDGKPGLTRLQGQVGYLATAMAPRSGPTDVSLISPTLITENELAARDLALYDVVILCNVRRLSKAQWRRMERFVTEGGGLIVYLGDLVDREHYNEHGAEVLPARLIKQAFPDLSDGKFVHFDAETLADALVPDFKGRERSGLFLARIHQYIEMATTLETGRTILSYTDGHSAIAERAIGAGRCVVVNTTANMEWTNLPAKGDFITLAMNLLHFSASAGALQRNLIVGDSFHEDVRTVSAEASDYHIRKPDGGEGRLFIESQGDGFRIKSDQLDQAGWFNLHAADVQGPVSVNLDPAESDLTGMSRAEVQGALDCEFEFISEMPEGGRLAGGGRSEFAPTMIYIVLLLLLAETLLAMWFGLGRR